MIFMGSPQGEADGAPRDRGPRVRLRTKPAVKRKSYYDKTESGLWNVTARRNTETGKLQVSGTTNTEREVIM